MLAMRPKRRAGKVVAGVALLALGGLGFMVVQSGLRMPKLPFGGQAAAASLSLPKANELNTTVTAAEPAKPEERKVEAAKAESPKAEAKFNKSTQASTALANAVGNSPGEPSKAEDRFTEE
jgi:hypothetical protein